MYFEKNVKVINKLGLHARAAAKVINLCAGYSSKITLDNGCRRVNAKSIMGVLMLASFQGTELKLVAEGDDAEQAIEEINRLFESRFDESE